MTTVSREATLCDVGKTLADERIAGVPVVEEGGRVLGVVSEGDIVRNGTGAAPGRALLDWVLMDRGPSKLAGRTVAERCPRLR